MGGLYPITSIVVGEKNNFGGAMEQCSSASGARRGAILALVARREDHLRIVANKAPFVLTSN